MPNNPRFFEDAREAMIKLTTLSHYLTRVELETLELLLDKHAKTEHQQESAGSRREQIRSDSRKSI